MPKVYVILGEEQDAGGTIIGVYKTRTDAEKHVANIKSGDPDDFGWISIHEMDVIKKYKKFKQPLLIPDAN